MGAQSRTAKRREERREQIWPGSKERLWPRESGWFKSPRILPEALLILDYVVGSGKDLTRTYLDLLSRNWGEGFVDVEDEHQAAYMAGFKTERGRRTWRTYLVLLERYGFIETKPVGNHKFGAILMVDPLRALCQLNADGKVPSNLWQLVLLKCDTFSMKPPDMAEFTPSPQVVGGAEKKKKLKKAVEGS